ncbi:MAG TPA: M1 family metallopeptidase [Thermoanaerobaculia bacterium]|nr:M1 family metallopeptidase [Thermoanaerobaculia bacterium]
MRKVAMIALALVLGCQQTDESSTTSTATQTGQSRAAADSTPHSWSKPNEAAVEHITLDLTVDFTKNQLAGTANLRIRNSGNANKLVLDTRDLTISRITLDDGTAAKYQLGQAQGTFGAPLEIDITPQTKSVTIEYATSPNAAALQWLEPSQTAGKKHPFLLSQSQAILARTWVPLQDTPSVRFTYDATIRVPKELLAVMSAENPTTKTTDGVYKFQMPQPIPSYLMALSVGDLAFRSLGPTTGVYAEPSVVARAAREFSDTQKMVAAAEKLYGPYRWGRYDMLVLPPSFPFGGMENPRLTFLTPTMIAGDRSLVSLIAHELAHSWSGNLVTNATWNDFWLNEGFTTYIERRISEELYGREHVEMLWTLGVKDLRDDFELVEPRDEHLVLDLAGRDPDEGMTQVAYEKGALFLRLIEETVGRQKFDAFLRQYFDDFAFQPMTTDRFMQLLRERLLVPNQIDESRLQVDAWLHGPGLPPNAPVPQSQAFTRVEVQAKAFAGGAAASTVQTQNWSTQEWLHFIHALPKDIGPARMQQLDQRFNFSRSGNNEILAAWLELAVENRYEAAYPALERFLTSQGRRKFLQPLYTKLAATPEGLERAKQIYAKARPGYHSVSRQTIDGILKWEQ